MRLPTMRRALLPATVVLLAAFIAWGLPPGTAAAHGATHAASGNGTITGTVVNGSKGNAPVAGQMVTLDVFVSHAETQAAATTTTDAQGHFAFTGLDGSGSTVYQLEAKYTNGDFTGALIDFANGPTESQTITVYDTTSNPSALSITNTTILFSPPDTKTGLIPVGMYITFKNSGNLAFVATTAAPAGGMPASLLRFSLPTDAQNLTLGAGFANVQVIQVDKGFAALATIPPGTTKFAYVYSLPYTGTDYHFQFKALYATSAVTALVPSNVFVDDGDFAPKPPVQALGQQYQLLEADNVQPDEVVSLRLWNLTVPGEQPDLDPRQLQILAAVLAALLGLLVGLYLKRGNLAVALGLLPASALAKPAESRGGQEREAEHKRLLKMLLTLEKQHTSGQLADAEYQRRRDNTRRTLKALLAESIATEPTHLSSRDKASIEVTSESQSAQADFVAAGPPGAVSTASTDDAHATPAGGAQPAAPTRARADATASIKSSRRRRALVGGRR